MGQRILDLDRDALLWINGHSSPVLDAILAPIAWSGEMGIIWMAVGAAMLVFGTNEHRKAALLFLITMFLVDRLINANLQHHLFRERPYLAFEGMRHLGKHWTTSSFPSGHAHSVWIAAIILGSRWRKLIPPLVLFALLTCYSRPYFGMHYPGDVIAGSVIGIAAGFGVLGLQGLWRRAMRRRSEETAEEQT